MTRPGDVFSSSVSLPRRLPDGSSTRTAAQNNVKGTGDISAAPQHALLNTTEKKGVRASALSSRPHLNEPARSDGLLPGVRGGLEIVARSSLYCSTIRGATRGERGPAVYARVRIRSRAGAGAGANRASEKRSDGWVEPSERRWEGSTADPACPWRGIFRIVRCRPCESALRPSDCSPARARPPVPRRSFSTSAVCHVCACPRPPPPHWRIVFQVKWRS